MGIAWPAAEKFLAPLFNARMYFKEVFRILKANGWYEVARKGSHIQFKHPTRPRPRYGASSDS